LETYLVSDDYRVKLDVFSGPLDLLLYLIKREELDIQDVALVQVTDQYLEYVRVLEALDPDAAGDFLLLASTLIEIKSRALLPAAPPEAWDDDDDPRASLVKELLEYKRFKDAARELGDAASERAKRYVRVPAELPKELAGIELEDVAIWDLVSAFSKVMTSIGAGPRQHEVSYDETPLEIWADEMIESIRQNGVAKFHDLFTGQRKRVEMIGMFLAMLELMRNHRLRIEQEKNFGVIYLFLLEEVEEGDDEPTPDTPVADEPAAPRLPRIVPAEEE
jgi:segregation and condensation protein A